ncbi:hepatic lectin-like [Glandiceps talaboti]
MKLTIAIISTLCMSIIVDAEFAYGPQQATWECPNGWKGYGTSCYYIGMDRVSWDVARQTCQDLGADLAMDKDEGTHQFINGMANDIDTSSCSPIWNCNIWLGLSYTPSTGFQWVDGTDLKTCFIAWGGAEPNGSPSSNWCVEYSISGDHWNDHGCPMERRYICEQIMCE